MARQLIAERNWGGFFDHLDTNGNGTLSHQEFWTYTDPNGGDEIIYHRTTNVTFKKDEENDKTISRAEFIEHMNNFDVSTEDLVDCSITNVNKQAIFSQKF